MPRFGLNLGAQVPTAPEAAQSLAQHAEALGFESVWTSEAYGTDAVTPLAWLAAHTSRVRLGTSIMQIPARTPATTAMTATSLDLLSSGRFVLGLGASGPQVAEGWHGSPYGRPLARTREYVEIVRTILRREVPLEHHGAHYDIPTLGQGTSGLGKPLKLAAKPLRADVPIYLAALGPANVRLAAEVADGWLPAFFAPARATSVFGDALAGAPPGFDVAPFVPVVVGDDIEACIDALRPKLALYLGGMGARGHNFYFDLACRYGYADAAARIQDHYLAGRIPQAVSLVPDDLVDEVALCGPAARIRERLALWEGTCTSMILSTDQHEALEAVAS
jgi:F420-dependent oxidoreductase-like protein